MYTYILVNSNSYLREWLNHIWKLFNIVRENYSQKCTHLQSAVCWYVPQIIQLSEYENLEQSLKWNEKSFWILLRFLEITPVMIWTILKLCHMQLNMINLIELKCWVFFKYFMYVVYMSYVISFFLTFECMLLSFCSINHTPCFHCMDTFFHTWTNGDFKHNFKGYVMHLSDIVKFLHVI